LIGLGLAPLCSLFQPAFPRHPKLFFTAAMEASTDLPARYAGDPQTQAIAVPSKLSGTAVAGVFFGHQFGGGFT
jgi:hypothetical protein